MALATLSIDLVAKIASFEAEMKRAAASAETTGQRIESAFGLAKAGIVGLVSALSVGAVVNFFRATADGVDKLNDLADATGSSIEKLSALEDVGARTGTSFESVGSALLKLNKVLNEALPGSQQAAALSAIGLSAEALRKQDPADAVLSVSTALAGYKDDAQKARLVQELFGKSTRDVAAFLKDLAEAGTLNSTVTTKQAKEAEKFNQELFAMQKNSQDTARRIVGDLVPALNTLLKGFNEGGVRGFGDQLGEVLGFGKEYYAKRTLKVATDDLANLQQQLKLETEGTGQFNAIKRLIDDATAKAKLAKAALGEAFESGFTPTAPKAPKVGNFKIDEKAVAEAKRAADEYLKLAEAVGLASTAASLEISGSDKLTDLQKLRIKLLEDLNNGQIKFTASQRASLQAIADSLPLLDKDLQLNRLKMAVHAQSTKLADQELAATQRQGEARLADNITLREQIAEFGKSAEAIEAMRIARLADMAVQEELTILGLRNIEGTQTETAARELNSKALRDQVDLRTRLLQQETAVRTDPALGASSALKDYVRQVDEAGLATQRAVSTGLATLEDDLTKSLASGKLSFSSFVNFALQEILRLQVVRPLIASLFGAGGGVSSLLSLFGGNAGTASLAASAFKSVATPLASGMDRVPYDGFPAILHEGERVLTKGEAQGGGWSGGASISVGAGQVINVGQGVSRAEVYAAVSKANAQNRDAIMRSLRQQGAAA